MKKFSIWLFLIWAIFLLGNTTFADDCKKVEFADGDWRVCVNINEQSSHTFELETDIEKWDGTLRCGILLSNNTYKEVPWCNDDFYVSNTDEQLIKLYIKLGSELPTDWEGKPNNKSEWRFPQWMYDFDNEEWTDGIGTDDDDNNNDVDNFYVSTNDSSPDTYEPVDLKIKARDEDNETVEDYTNAVEFTVYYRTSSYNSWRETSSSYYFEFDNDYEDGYDFSSSDDGYVTLYDAIEFKKSYDFKVVVEDEDDSDIYWERIFYVGDDWGNDDNDVDNFYVSTNDSSPDTYEPVDLKIKARDEDNETVEDYTNAVEFTVYYRTSSSSSWRETSSSYYFEFDNDYEDGYDFSSSDDGYVTLYDAIEFKKPYDFKVVVEDEDDDDIYWERIFYVGDDEDEIDWFTNEEIEQIENVYDIRDMYIESLKDSSSRLRYNTTWLNMSDNLKEEMEKILDDDDDRFDDYEEFSQAFEDRYSYTVRNK